MTEWGEQKPPDFLEMPRSGSSVAKLSDPRSSRGPGASARTRVILGAIAAVVVLGIGAAAFLVTAGPKAVPVVANAEFSGPYQIAPNGELYTLDGNAVSLRVGVDGGASRRLDLATARCRVERPEGRRGLAEATDAIFVSAVDDRVIVFGTRAGGDAGERHVSIGCLGHLNTGVTQSIEEAMPDLATLLGTRDGSTLHMRAGTGGRLYVWSASVPFTLFDGKGASSRLLAGDTQKGACTVAESSHLTVACAYATGEPGQAELRVSTFSNDWPPVRGSYDVLPLSIEAPTDFALSDDGSELASWGSRHHVATAASKPGEGAFDSHVALVTLGGNGSNATVFDTHWQADRPIAASRFDPDRHGILVLESDGSAAANLRLVPRAGYLPIEHVAVPHATELAIAGPHRLWLVAPGSAAAIDEPPAEPVPPPK